MNVKNEETNYPLKLLIDTGADTSLLKNAQNIYKSIYRNHTTKLSGVGKGIMRWNTRNGLYKEILSSFKFHS